MPKYQPKTIQSPPTALTPKIFTLNFYLLNLKKKSSNKITKCIMKFNNGKWAHSQQESLTPTLKSLKYAIKHSEKINLKKRKTLHHFLSIILSFSNSLTKIFINKP